MRSAATRPFDSAAPTARLDPTFGSRPLLASGDGMVYDTASKAMAAWEAFRLNDRQRSR